MIILFALLASCLALEPEPLNVKVDLPKVGVVELKNGKYSGKMKEDSSIPVVVEMDPPKVMRLRQDGVAYGIATYRMSLGGTGVWTAIKLLKLEPFEDQKLLLELKDRETVNYIMVKTKDKSRKSVSINHSVHKKGDGACCPSGEKIVDIALFE